MTLRTSYQVMDDIQLYITESQPEKLLKQTEVITYSDITGVEIGTKSLL
jgi:hypothetical protein